MRQKKLRFYISLICLLMLMVLAGIYLISDSVESSAPAKQYSELLIQVRMGDTSEKVKIWQAEDGMYYFFLPAAAELSTVSFVNIDGQDELFLDELSFTGKEPGFGPDDLQLEYSYSMQLVADGMQLAPVQVTFMQSAKLAAMFVDTESGSLDTLHAEKGLEEKARLRVIDAAGRVDYSSAIPYIRTRGNSTYRYYDKKAYQFKLYSDASLLSMAKAEKWILLANAVDDSLMRNALVYDFTSEYTDIPSVEGHFVDLYMNGTYQGNYYLCEKVEVDGQRLDITDLEAYNHAENGRGKLEQAQPYQSEDGKIRAFSGLKNPEDITGGYLVESIAEGEYNNVESGFCTNGGFYFEIVSPQQATVEQAEYIYNLFNEIEAAVSTENGIHPQTGRHYTEYIDLDSWVVKYLIDTVFHNPDAELFSLFFYKDSDKVDSHIYAGPVWDYDRAVGSYGVEAYELDDPLYVGVYDIYVPEIIEKFPEAMELLTEKFEDVFAAYIDNDLNRDLYEYKQQLKASYRMNDIRWPEKYGYFEGLDANVAYIQNFLHQKREALQEIWIEDAVYHEVTFIGYNGEVFKTYRVKHGECLETAVPNAASYEAVFAGWVNEATGKVFDARVPVAGDVVYTAEWIDWNVLLQNGLAIADLDISRVNVEELERLVEIIKENKK